MHFLITFSKLDSCQKVTYSMREDLYENNKDKNSEFNRKQL